MKSDYGKLIKSFGCRAYVNVKLFLLITICILGFLYGFFELYFYDFNSPLTGKIFTKGIIGLLIGVVFAALSVSVFVKQRKCYISLCENGIYGLKPAFPGKAKYFEIYYEDIVKIYDIILPTSRALPVALIRTKTRTYFFICLEKEDLKFLLSYTKRKISAN